MPPENKQGRPRTEAQDPPVSIVADVLLVLMPQRFQHFFAFVLSDFATAFFSEVTHSDSFFRFKFMFL